MVKTIWRLPTEEVQIYLKHINIAVPKTLKRRKTTVSGNFCCPTYKEYHHLIDNNYKVLHLKEICRKYKQKLSGNKNELVFRIFNYLRLSKYSCVIQKLCRKFLIKKYNFSRGPAHIKRNLCVNKTDFLTMDELSDISYNQFISFCDENNQIYGFDILSLDNLFLKGGNITTNPYNRQILPASLKSNIKFIIRACKIFKEKIVIKIEQPKPLSIAKQLELKTVSIFQDIDNLGNYTDPQWFNNLGRVSMIRFLRELADIWEYRAQLSQETKREICPPIGTPMRNISLHALPNYTLEILKKNTLIVIENLVKRGVNETNRALGANYVLCALTLVSEEAANALPWLYQSVAQHV